MATYKLVMLVRVYLVDPASLRKRCPNPMLVWEPPAHEEGPIATTDVSGMASELAKGDPVAIELVKGAASNAFPFGVTVGYSEGNDVVLRDPQVSGFHAYFQESNHQRFLVDASSRNGTWIDDQKLLPSKAYPLPAKVTLRFGKLAVTYVEPDQMGAFLDMRLKSG